MTVTFVLFLAYSLLYSIIRTWSYFEQVYLNVNIRGVEFSLYGFNLFKVT